MCLNCISNHFYWLIDTLLMLNLMNYKVSKIVQVPGVEKHWSR